MVVAPGADLTQKSVRSNMPLVLLAAAYGAVLLASWSTDTLHLMMPGSLEEGLKGGHSTACYITAEHKNSTTTAVNDQRHGTGIPKHGTA